MSTISSDYPPGSSAGEEITTVETAEAARNEQSQFCNQSRRSGIVAGKTTLITSTVSSSPSAKAKTNIPTTELLEKGQQQQQLSNNKEDETILLEEDDENKPLVYVVISTGDAIDKFAKGIETDSNKQLSTSLRRRLEQGIAEADVNTALLFVPSEDVHLHGILEEETADGTNNGRRSGIVRVEKLQLTVGQRDVDVRDVSTSRCAVSTRTLFNFPGVWFAIKYDETSDRQRVVKLGKEDLLKTCPSQDQCKIQFIYTNNILQDVKKLTVTRRKKRRQPARNDDHRDGSNSDIPRPTGSLLKTPLYIRQHLKTYGRPPFSVPNYKRSHRTAYELIKNSFP